MEGLRTGTCPKCGNNDIYTTRGTSKRGDRMIIPASSFDRIFLDTYICIDCGYFEEIVPPEELKEKMKSSIIKNWKKVK